MSASHTATLDITGMTCASCAASIESVLRALPGITAASVNLASAKARVEYAPERIGVQAIIARIGKAGFGAVPARELDADELAAREAQERAAWRRELALFAVAAALTLPLLAMMVTMFDFGNLSHALRGHHTDLLPRWLQ